MPHSRFHFDPVSESRMLQSTDDNGRTDYADVSMLRKQKQREAISRREEQEEEEKKNQQQQHSRLNEPFIFLSFEEKKTHR